MVVDDEVFNVRAICGLLMVLKVPQDVIVDIAYNGEEALELVKSAIQDGDPLRYSLILTDCSMPFLDGYKMS